MPFARHATPPNTNPKTGFSLSMIFASSADIDARIGLKRNEPIKPIEISSLPIPGRDDRIN
jgi:hypothetical protein